MTEAKRLEEMKNELSAAGYVGEWMPLGDYQAFVFSFADGIEVSGMDKIESIKTAYRYLQKEKQFTAMEALLREIVDSYDAVPEIGNTDVDLYNAAGAIEFMRIAGKAKAILEGKEE